MVNAPHRSAPNPANRPDRSNERPVDRIVHRLRDDVGCDRFERYFNQAKLEFHKGKLDVTVPTGFAAELLDRRFGQSIRRAITESSNEGGEPVQLSFHVDQSAFEAASRVESHVRQAAQTAEGDVPVAPKPRWHQSSGDRSRPRRNLNPMRHRLDDFILGESNRLAYTASVRLTQTDCPRRFSPLFIHGTCGVGKTHLLQGLATQFAEANPQATVRCITAETFTNEFINAIRENKLASFRKAYRGVDLLCIDDVHFLANKDATQKELLHTFDAIDLDGARVAMASDGHPRQIRQLSQGLVSRFMAGMVVELAQPEPALCGKLMTRIAARRGLALEPEASDLLAGQCRRRSLAQDLSVRDIEGMLTSVEAVRKLLPDLHSNSGKIGVALIRQALNLSNGSPSVRGRPAKPIKVSQIAAAACQWLQVDMEDLTGRSRHKRVVMARSLTAHLSRTMTTMSFPEIARAMGRPNHSTIVTACKRFQGQIDADQPVDLGPEFQGMTVKDLCEQVATELQRGARTG